MEVRKTDIDGLLIVSPSVYSDGRGYLVEVWKYSTYHAEGMRTGMLQDNLSWSRRGVLRGMHFQNPRAQEKLVYVLYGEVFDVVVDLRCESPTFAKWFSIQLSSENHKQLYVPAGFAHGFCVLSDSALVAYKATSEYCPQAEMSLAWDDPQIAIEWPILDPILSIKDRAAPRLEAIPSDRLPRLAKQEASFATAELNR